jgi:signal transduction histidine kinase
VKGSNAGRALLFAGAVAVVVLPVAGVVGHQPARAFATLPLVLVYYLIGAVAFLQRPDQRAAVRLLGASVATGVPFAVGYAWSAYVDLNGMPAWSGVAIVVLAALTWGAAASMLTVFSVFPDGHYHRQWEQSVVWAAWAAVPVLVAAQVVGSAQLVLNTPYVWLDGDLTGANPYAVPGLAVVGRVASGVTAASQLVVVLGVVVLVRRYRRSGPETRRQIAWPLYALALSVVALAMLGSASSRINTMQVWQGYLLYYPVLLLLPAGLLIGMLRYRLLDIRLVVRRSIVYGVLWLLITLAYVSIAAVLGVLAGRRVPLELAILLTILTTVVAAPARRRLERLADRVAYGQRLTGYELLSDLGARLESSLIPSEVAGTLARGVQEGLGARWVRVVFAGQNASTPVAVAGSVPSGDPALVVPLMRGDDVLGAIECGPKADGIYLSGDGDLLRTLGRQAALALANARLSAELSARLVELAASRARLVQAEDAGRRRLERDLHDGVQQELVALLARLGMARNQLRRDSRLGQESLMQAQADARRTLERLQEVARGIHPPVLTDRGLLEAVEELLTRLPLPAKVSSESLGHGVRLDPSVEGAAYFVVSEALANVLKHARAQRAMVCLQLRVEGLVVEVSDDGCGFEAAHTTQRGLRGLADRVEALGGRLQVASTAGQGTTVRAVLPGQERIHA